MLTRKALALALYLLAFALAFEAAASLFATCGGYEHGKQVSANQNESYCSSFSGPIVLYVSAVAEWDGGMFDHTGEAILAALTMILAISTVFLWIATTNIAEEARREFAATHRPNIIVHTFEHAPDDKKQIGAVLTYVNAGATDALILEIKSKIFEIAHALRPGVAMDSHAFTSKRLVSGEVATFAVELEISDTHGVVNRKREERGFSSHDIMCIGFVRYSDEDGRERRTGFCRRYDADSRTWLRVEASDYEYAYEDGLETLAHSRPCFLCARMPG